MLQSVSIEGYTSFPGVRWQLVDPTTELVLRVEGRAESPVLERYGQWFERRFAGCFRFGEEHFPDGWLANPGADALAVHLAAGITALQRLACQPVRRAQVLEAEDQGIRLALPSFSGPVLQGAIQLAIQLLLELEADPAGTGERLQELEEEVDQFLKRAPEVSRCGEEAMHFALAASELGIPVVSTATGYLEIGHGCARRVLSNSLCYTPSPAASLASDKMASYLVLHRAGLPVPATRIVNTEAELEAAAAEIGWPLVVKPLDQSLKRGVTTDVADQISLRAAFLVARNVSQSSVLLQEQVHGDEFRLLGIGEKFALARQVNPAIVEGDGRCTIEELITNFNRDPMRGENPGALGPPICVNDDLVRFLAQQGLDLSFVPAHGQPVRLSCRVGFDTGSITTDFTSQLHPSYFDLMHRAARVLQLDIVGLDLITPDPYRPWWEVGAKMLECNPRPGLIQHEHADPALRIYQQMLCHCLEGCSSPLIVALAGDVATQQCMSEMECALSAKLQSPAKLGTLWQGICRIGSRPLPVVTSEKGQVGQALLADPACGSLLLVWDADELAAFGRPCERLDLAVLSGGANPLILKEIIDADPAVVVLIGSELDGSTELFSCWQSEDSKHQLIRLEKVDELKEHFEILLDSFYHKTVHADSG